MKGDFVNKHELLFSDVPDGLRTNGMSDTVADGEVFMRIPIIYGVLPLVARDCDY